jgi:hypothetical protein
MGIAWSVLEMGVDCTHGTLTSGDSLKSSYCCNISPKQNKKCEMESIKKNIEKSSRIREGKGNNVIEAARRTVATLLVAFLRHLLFF